MGKIPRVEEALQNAEQVDILLCLEKTAYI
jgi:hypothetical protein